MGRERIRELIGEAGEVGGYCGAAVEQERRWPGPAPVPVEGSDLERALAHGASVENAPVPVVRIRALP
jgi:hypothetical protein